MKKVQKHSLTLLFLIVSSLTFSQNIFKYEREINHKEKYDFQEIEFQNKDDNIQLSGTLIKPKSDFDKIIIIVPGSGKDTRHSHFVLAEEFLRKQIAVYRFDNRGLGKSEGEYLYNEPDLFKDLGYAYSALKRLYPNVRIGIFGHSRGGLAALEMIKNKSVPNFLILMEPTIKKNGSYILNGLTQDIENDKIPEFKKYEKEDLIEFFKKSFAIIGENEDEKVINSKIRSLIKKMKLKKRFIHFLDDKEMIEMIKIDIERTVADLDIPTLILYGTSKEVLDEEAEIATIESFENPKITIKVFEGLNHWLTDRNGAVGSSLYQMDKEPLSLIINWLAGK